MALDRDKLRDELRKLMDPDFGQFVGFPATAAAAKANWAAAYHAYALDAVDIGGDTFLAPPVLANFQDQLVFAQGAADGSALAAEFAAAFTAYWTGVTFANTTPPSGTGSPCPNVPVIQMTVKATSAVTVIVNAGLLAALLAEFAINSEDGEAKAEALADAFHTATTTGVTVLVSGTGAGGPPPPPVTNTCFLQ